MDRPLLAPALLAASVGILASLSLLAPAALAADPAACAALAGVARAPGEVLQDDAGSGGDAGDSAGAAAPMPQLNYSYSWGFVEPGVGRDFADLEDWFSIELGGWGAPAMAEVNATFHRSDALPYALVDQDGPLRFQITAFPPDGSDPLVGVPNGNGGTHVRFFDTIPGEWLFQVRLPYVLGGAAACAGPYANPSVPGPANPAPATNYGVYFGCHPHCVKDVVTGT